MGEIKHLNTLNVAQTLVDPSPNLDVAVVNNIAPKRFDRLATINQAQADTA